MSLLGLGSSGNVVHAELPNVSAEDEVYSTSLSSAILPSMDLSEILPSSQSIDKTPLNGEVLWSWQDRAEKAQSTSIEPQVMSPVSSPRQRHTFLQNPSYVFSTHQHSSALGLCSDGYQSPNLPVFNSDQPPSPGCCKKSKRARRPLPPTLEYLYLASLRLVSPKSHLWNSRWLWLILYFSFNLFLTLSNKSVLTSFPFPYTLTGLHTLCSTVGCYILRSRGVYVSKPLNFKHEFVLAAFSVLYAVNIVVSNVSLQLVTVPLHQVIRAATPIFTILLSTFLFSMRTKRTNLLSLSPVIFGVIIATYGDYYFTAWGLFLTLVGTFLAALKTIYTNLLQSSNTSNLLRPHTYNRPSAWGKLLVPPSIGIHPLDLLMRMSPLAFIQCIMYAQASGELDRVRQLSYLHSYGLLSPPSAYQNFTVPSNCTYVFADATMTTVAERSDMTGQTMALLLNGCIAFGLNVVSLTANGKIGALSMTVAANVKQVLTILFAVFLFDLTITPLNAFGITVTLLGGAWYAWGEYMDKQAGSRLSDRRDSGQDSKA